MTQAILTRRQQAIAARLPLVPIDVTRVAEGLVIQALELCAHEMALDGSQSAAHRVEQGDGTACSYFLYGLTQKVVQCLSASGGDVRAIYALDENAAPQSATARTEGEEGPLIRLLVWRRCRTTAFDSLVAAMDRALVQLCADLTGKRELKALLDVEVLDDHQVQAHFGSGRDKRIPMLLGAYMLAQNESVDMVYARDALSTG